MVMEFWPPSLRLEGVVPFQPVSFFKLIKIILGEIMSKANNKYEKNYKIITVLHNSNEEIEYEVVGLSDGFAWGKGKSIKGAVIGALINKVRLNQIDFNGHWVPVQECLNVVMR